MSGKSESSKSHKSNDDSLDSDESSNSNSDEIQRNISFLKPSPKRYQYSASEKLFQKHMGLTSRVEKIRYRDIWMELLDEEKMIYINKVYEDVVKISKSEGTILNSLTKLEWAIYLRYTTRPDKPPIIPPKEPYALYPVEEKISGDEEMLTIQEKRFFDLNYDKQKEILKKFIELWATFDAEFEKWKEDADPLLVKAFQRAHPKRKEYRRTYPKIEFEEVAINFVSGFYPPLKEWPPFPPLTRHQLYAECLGIEFSLKSLIPNGVNIVVKSSLRKVVEGMVEKYSQLLCDYVDELSPPNKRLFLGLKRKYFYEIFKWDLFESRFPYKYYPLYKKFPVRFFVGKELDEEPPTSDFDALKIFRDSIAELRSFINDCPSESDTNEEC